MAEIIDYTEPVKVNPYAQDVADLIAAGEGKAIQLVVPAADRNKTRLAFAKAANDADKTARLRKEGPDKSGKNVVLTFTLTAKQKTRRGKTTATETAEEQVSE